jgi:hypothetical protein
VESHPEPVPPARTYQVVASSHRTSFDALAYEKGETLWLIAAGCCAPRYNSNQATKLPSKSWLLTPLRLVDGY